MFKQETFSNFQLSKIRSKIIYQAKAYLSHQHFSCASVRGFMINVTFFYSISQLNFLYNADLSNLFSRWQNLDKIQSWLLRCSTARGSISGLFLGGPTKFKACKSFIFTEGSLKVENKEHLFVFVVTLNVLNHLYTLL